MMVPLEVKLPPLVINELGWCASFFELPMRTIDIHDHLCTTQFLKVLFLRTKCVMQCHRLSACVEGVENAGLAIVRSSWAFRDIRWWWIDDTIPLSLAEKSNCPPPCFELGSYNYAVSKLRLKHTSTVYIYQVGEESKFAITYCSCGAHPGSLRISKTQNAAPTFGPFNGDIF